MMKKTPVFLMSLLLTLLAATICAQTVPPALMVKVKKKSQPLGLSKLAVEARIFGRLAETTTTMTFANPMDRVMEGDLYFPLPEGATVSGYALDIEGRMVDGVAVEKHKGRQVFEKIVRQGIDPGLIEWTKGNNFKTRVFPIPAKGSRTIRVRYVTELIGGKEGAISYHLPLNFKDPLAQFSLRVEVVKPTVAPTIKQGKLANFQFGKWRDGYVAETKLTDVALTEDLIIALPEAPSQKVMVEKAPDGKVYFAIEDFPPVPKEKADPAMPKHVVVYWDASGSRAGSDQQREIDLLAKCLSRFLPKTGKSPGFTVDLVLFRNAAQPPQRFKWMSLNRSDPRGNAALIEAIRNVQYDGGTQLAAVSPWPEADRPDFYLLFTDGVSNFGKDRPEGLQAPLYAFSAAATADHAALHNLAMTTGGRYFNLKRMTDDQVVAAVGRESFCFLSADAAGDAVTGLCPAQPQPISGRFTLAGRLTAERTIVTVRYGYPGKNRRARAFIVSADDAVEGTLLRRLWAQKRLAELMVSQKQNEKQIVSLGKEHGLVTPFTSLIVLDSLEQYVEHRIAPPRSLPKMRDEYNRRIDTIEMQRKKEQTDKLTDVVAMWQQRVKWWENEFKYPKDFKYKGGDKDKAEAPELEDAFGGEPDAEMPRDAPGGGGAGGGFFGPSGGDVDRLSESAKAEKELEASVRQPGIVVKPWDPKTPYLAELKAAKGKQKAFAVYMKNREQFGTSPAFFLDCADYFDKQADIDLPVQILSNIAEMELENPALLRVLGHRLTQIRRFDLAVDTFEEVLRLRPEEPQSYRDLALALARRAEELSCTQMLSIDPLETLDMAPPTAVGGRSEKKAAKEEPPKGVKHMTVEDVRQIHNAIRADYARALNLLNHLLIAHWDRFEGIELIALMEANRIIPQAKRFGVKIPLDKRLIKQLDCDIRIVMTWHADNTDMDLHVTEPSGETAFYGHQQTTIGGLVSEDFTDGYGPEEYFVRKAMPGMYKIQADYFGSQAVKLLGAVTVQVDIFTNFGREDEQRKSLTVRLKEAKDMITIGQIEF